MAYEAINLYTKKMPIFSLLKSFQQGKFFCAMPAEKRKRAVFMLATKFNLMSQ